MAAADCLRAGQRRAAILSALVEGNSIAGTCRMFGVNKITVLRLIADAGTLAQSLHDELVHDLATKRIECDNAKKVALKWGDHGPEHHLLWVVCIDATGEIWSFENPQVRGTRNVTWGRINPARLDRGDAPRVQT